MAVNKVDAQKEIAAPPDKVFRAISDYKQRTQWLPSNYSDYKVEKAGKGGSTIVTYRLKVGNRVRNYRMAVEEPVRGSVLTERDANSSLATTWTVSRHDTGARVSLHTEWQGAGGVGGFFERLFAPRALKRVYDDSLSRLDRYATAKGGGS